MRPNGRIGWVKAVAVQTRPVRSRIVVDLSSRKLRILQGGKTQFATRVAVGRRGLETPTGNFYITATFKPTEHFLGAFAFETSAYSKLSEWPGGGVVGLHGTSMPWLLGQAVSHGCVRMSNAAALVLKRLTPACWRRFSASSFRVIRQPLTVVSDLPRRPTSTVRHGSLDTPHGACARLAGFVAPSCVLPRQPSHRTRRTRRRDS